VLTVVLAELHLHLYGCISPPDLLRHLSGSERVLWDWYEAGMEAAYGAIPPTREIVERHRKGDPDAAKVFEQLFVFGDDDAGNFERFGAKFHLLYAGSKLGQPDAAPAGVAAEVAAFAEGIRDDHVRQGVA
jgi:hypothetical protein